MRKDSKGIIGFLRPGGLVLERFKVKLEASLRRAAISSITHVQITKPFIRKGVFGLKIKGMWDDTTIRASIYRITMPIVGDQRSHSGLCAPVRFSRRQRPQRADLTS